MDHQATIETITRNIRQYGLNGQQWVPMAIPQQFKSKVNLVAFIKRYIKSYNKHCRYIPIDECIDLVETEIKNDIGIITFVNIDAIVNRNAAYTIAAERIAELMKHDLHKLIIDLRYYNDRICDMSILAPIVGEEVLYDVVINDIAVPQFIPNAIGSLKAKVAVLTTIHTEAAGECIAAIFKRFANEKKPRARLFGDRSVHTKGAKFLFRELYIESLNAKVFIPTNTVKVHDAEHFDCICTYKYDDAFASAIAWLNA